MIRRTLSPVLLVLIGLLVTSCNSCCGCRGTCKPPPYECHDGVGHDADIVPVGDAGPDALVDAGPDAPPRPDETAMRCVGPRGKSLDECRDTFEQNDDLIEASAPGSRECDFTQKDGKLGGGDDVDVYRTGGCELAGASTDPLLTWVELDSQPGAAEDISSVLLCIFPTCTEGSTNVYECYDTPLGQEVQTTTPATTGQNLAGSQVGFRGCCRVGPGRITAKVSCPRGSRNLDTFLWVDQGKDGNGRPNDFPCVPYRISYWMK